MNGRDHDYGHGSTGPSEPPPDLTEPPNDLHAERAAIGSAIQSSYALGQVLSVMRPEDCYRPAHTAILRAAQAVDDSGDPVDPVTVSAELDRRGHLTRAGGAAGLIDLVQAAPMASNGARYGEIVADKATLRALAEAATRIHQRAHQPVDDPAAVVERARADLDAVAGGARSPDVAYTAAELYDAAVERYANPLPPGLPTGWRDLDAVVRGGLRAGWLVIVGARPKVGKSMIGVTLPLRIAQAGKHTAIVSLEMPRTELADRLVAQLAGIDLDSLRECRLNEHEWQRIHDAAAELRSLPLTVLDNKRQTLTSIRARVRDLQRAGGCDLLVVDYLGLVTPADSRVPRQEQVAAISRGLKLLAGELDIPIVALAQINRGPEMRMDKRPQPSDLRESGAIEADADQVWLLHRDDVEKPGELEVNIALNRHGPAHMVRLSWVPRYARVADLARYDEDERRWTA